MTGLMLVLALGVGATRSRQPIFKVYRSVEVMALSGASMIGTATRIEPPAPGGEQFKVCVVFSDCFELDSHKSGAVYGAYLSVDKSRAQEWISAKARILSFQDGEWLNLDDPETKIFDAKLRPVKGVGELVQAIRKARKAHPEIERVRPFYRPLSKEEEGRMGVEPGSKLAVPYDRKVERWAHDQLRSRDGSERLQGVMALRGFDSDANAARLKRLLKDPYTVQYGDQPARFPIREEASRILEDWGLNREVSDAGKKPVALLVHSDTQAPPVMIVEFGSQSFSFQQAHSPK